MKAIKDVTIAMLLSAILAIILIPGIAAAQEEAIPSLRLDRLPIFRTDACARRRAIGV
jgi:hypothetical protein